MKRITFIMLIYGYLVTTNCKEAQNAKNGNGKDSRESNIVIHDKSRSDNINIINTGRFNISFSSNNLSYDYSDEDDDYGYYDGQEIVKYQGWKQAQKAQNDLKQSKWKFSKWSQGGGNFKMQDERPSDKRQQRNSLDSYRDNSGSYGRPFGGKIGKRSKYSDSYYVKYEREHTGKPTIALYGDSEWSEIKYDKKENREFEDDYGDRHMEAERHKGLQEGLYEQKGQAEFYKSKDRKQKDLKQTDSYDSSYGRPFKGKESKYSDSYYVKNGGQHKGNPTIASYGDSEIIKFDKENSEYEDDNGGRPFKGKGSKYSDSYYMKFGGQHKEELGRELYDDYDDSERLEIIKYDKKQQGQLLKKENQEQEGGEYIGAERHKGQKQALYEGKGQTEYYKSKDRKQKDLKQIEQLAMKVNGNYGGEGKYSILFK